MVSGQGMSVFSVQESEEGVFISLWFSCTSVSSLGASAWPMWHQSGEDRVRVSGCVVHAHTHISREDVCLSLAPSLGRRQSQRWGCSSAAPAASQANLGGEKHFDPGLQV